ncbi:YjzD family protein [Bacillus sp. T33-2]|uniref:YjzD family protein n=1 Tax=Bacillus sp. T33-2 TaxID=2054168 RepID=UPI000C77B7F2|nr:YjzD family protein [Bacillus sp. T33-2]PLR97624.1 DUF2929 domain-containing protein [Bacillus sp. T33-2]
MKYFWTLFWTFLLVQMLTYVASSMLGVAFDFETGSILAIIAAILIFAVPFVIPNEPSDKQGLH